MILRHLHYAGGMTWKRFIIGSGVALVVASGGFLAWAWTTDLGRFQGFFEEQLRSATGYTVRFERLSVELGPGLTVSADGLTVHNPAAPEAGELLAVQQLELRLALLSLVASGPVEVERIRVDGARIDLRWDESDRSNWDAGAEDDGDDDGNTSPLPLVIRDGEFTALELEVRDPDRDGPITAAFETLGLVLGENAFVRLDLEGTVNGQPVRFDGRTGPWAALLEAGAVAVAGEGRLGALTFDVDARFDDLAAPDRPELVVNASGPDIRRLEQVLGLEPGEAAPYELQLRATAEDEHWTVTTAAQVGAFRLDLEGRAGGLQTPDPVDVNLDARGPNLERVLRLAGIDGAPSAPFEVKGQLQRTGPNLIFRDVAARVDETEFILQGQLDHFPHLRDSRLALRVAGPNLEQFRALLDLPGIASGPFELEAELEPGEGTLDLLKGRLVSNLGTVEVSGTLTEDADYVGSEATVRMDGDDAAAILAAFDQPPLASGSFTFESEFAVEKRAVRFRSAKLAGLWQATLTADGTVPFDDPVVGAKLRVGVQGDDLEATLRALEQPWPLGPSPYELGSRVRFTGDGMRLDDLEGRIGETDLAAEAFLPFDEDLAGLDVDLQTAGPDLRTLLATLEPLDVPEADWDLAVRLRRVNEALRLDTLELRVAQSTLTGNLRVPWPPQRGEGQFSLALDSPNLARSLPRIHAFRPAAGPTTAQLSGAISDGVWRIEPSRLGFGDATLELEGDLGRLPGLDDLSLSLSLRVPNLADVGTFQDEALPQEPLALDARVIGSRERLVVQSLRLETAASTLTGNAELRLEDAPPFVAVTATAPTLDLRPLLPTVSELAEDENKDGRLIPDTPLPFERLSAVNGTVDLGFDRLLLHDRTVTDVEVSARLQDGTLDLERYHTRGAIGELQARGQIRPVGSGAAQVDFRAEVLGLVLGYEAWKQSDPATLPRIDAMIEASATGGTLRELAAGLNGNVALVASEGQLPGRGLEALNNFLLSELIALLAPGADMEKPTVLTCMAVHLVAKDGILTTEPAAALRTRRLLVLTSGKVNLRDETLDLGFKTTPTKVFGTNLAELINPFVRVRGTLAKPEPVMDPGGTLVYGGAAAATGGLSILAKALWDRLQKASNPCDRLRDDLRERFGEGSSRNDS